jgi:type VI secretion system secreted protein VgrG
VDTIGSKFDYELFDYPGEYPSKSDGESLVKLRMETEEAISHLVQGRSDRPCFCPGFRFKLRNHYRSDFNIDYLLTSITHSFDQDLGTGTKVHEYTNTFSCMPHSVNFRPAQTTPKPVVRGPQSAIVTGPEGEEIYTDEYGRIKVQFFWDRYGEWDEKSSCWIRVSHSWAGKSFGGITHPRIGQEVLVEFLEGDPDRPIITGRVYNAEQMPPYELPRHQTMSTLRSRSTKEGAPNNFNELRFEDEIGKEQVFLHAEMDMDRRVKNDSRAIVSRDDHVIIERHQKARVEGNKHGEVYGDHLEKIGGSMSLDVGGDRHEKVGNVYTSETGSEIHLKAGMKVVIDAGVQIHLKVGGNHIDISPGGIVIQGTMVRINSGPATGTGTASNPKDPASPDVADDGTARTKLS